MYRGFCFPDTSRITSYTNLKTFQDTRTGEVLVEVCGHKYPIDSTSSFDDDATPCTTEDMDYVEDDQTHSEHLEKDTIDSMAATANDISMHSETNLLLEKLICYGEESESTRALETRIESTTENRFSVAMITDEDGTRTTAPFIPQCAMRKSTISSTSSECRTVPQCSMRKSTISSTSSECRTVPQCSMRKSTISSTSSDCRIVQQPHDLPACRQYVSLPFSMSPISDPVTLPAVRADSSQNFQMTSSLGGSDSRSTALVERNNSSKFCPKTLPLSFSTSILNPGTQRTLQQDVPLYFSRSTFQNPVTQANSSQPLPKDVPLCYSSASVSNLMTLPVVSDFNQNNVPMPSTLSFSHHEPYQSFQPEHLQVVKPVIRSQITSHSQPGRFRFQSFQYISVT